VIPVHSGETIGPGLLHRILRDCHLTAGDLMELV
jgi:predicted RNA binding protein YcfA (HicA-like mRNA interferase family)